MSDQLSGIEARIRQLEAVIADLQPRLASVEQHVDHLEADVLVGARAVGLSPASLQPGGGSFTAIRSGLPDVGSIIGLIGRTLFVLAGAFLLRALTDSGRLDAGLGVVIGLVFATTWAVLADLAGRRGQRGSAVFHGLAFILIAFPLLLEATTRFHFLTPVIAASSLGISTAIALVVSWRQRLQSLAWVASAGGVVTALSLAVATAETGPFALFLVGLGIALLWFGYVLDWRLLRWPAALFADVAILVVSVRAVTPGSADTPAVAYASQILLLVAYLGSFATRTLVLNRDAIPFEVAQSIAATFVGLGGAAVLTHMSPARTGELPLGIATLALAAGCYGAAAIFIERRQSRRRNYYFYTSAGLVFALAGVALSLPHGAVGLVYAAFGVIAASLGRTSDRSTYRAHGAAYLVAGAAVTGVFPYVLYGLGVPVIPPSSPSLAIMSVLLFCGVAMWGLRSAASSAIRRVPRLLVLLLLLGGVFGAAVNWVLSAPGNSLADMPGTVATVRTALLVGGILALAFADRAWAFIEGGWLVYPLLGLTGLKFLVEDVRVGRPATLVVGFALYGLALVVAPRLRRRDGLSRSGDRAPKPG